tara:strand:+ start:940 stop:1176 length:237 start_codon:yes stop_codon:yes gene_type:complete
MKYQNRKWVIVNNSNVTDEMIASAIQTSRDTLRHTITGTNKVILKWDGDTPEIFDGMTTYNHSEILTELAKSTWTRDE